MDLVIWTYIFGGATLFGIIVGIFSAWNGRMTRRELREVMAQGNSNTRELIEQGNSGIRELIEQMARHMQDMDRRHTELLSELLKKST